MTELQDLLSLEIEATRSKRNKMLYVVSNHVSPDELEQVIQQIGIPAVHVSLLLSEQLRMLPLERRPFEVGKILRSLVMRVNNDVIFLNHIEYLFDRELKQNPIRLFENLSGNKIIIIRWPGTVECGSLKYATPEHHENYQSDNSYASYIIEI
ncbi:hypothetical protein SAMN04487897_12514 [Paenibacillus sp. yr247]|uniref:BREX-3 system P-loop-containing protein BrxF n=1 Tax=Paenibacillus sp. yr247 TaxID=1761880 RepID=UPI00087E90E3|nr:BREX-3 system P-loop-containing protein BrxF [Paenibacillus sp. yr247]SDO87065.1 hypothetical protein SAMN04487897_12514 [Paenibacillus sp. yr247]